MTKVFLINPNFTGVSTVPSLGLGFLGGYLKRNMPSLDMEVIEPQLQKISRDECLERASKSDYIGMTCYTESRFQCLDFANEVKERNSSVKIILGGPHVFSLDKLILEHWNSIDYVVRGDGEEPLLSLMRGINEETIPNLTYRKGTSIISNPIIVSPTIDDYEHDYSLIRIPEWKDPEVPRYLQKYNHIPFIASRGCPFNCIFCGTPTLCGRKWRGYSPTKLVNILESLVEKYKVRYFRFYDALFIPNKKDIKDFCELVKEKDLDIFFRIDSHIGVHNEPELKLLKEVGCTVLGYGIESGNDRVLQRIGKGITVKEILATLKVVKRLGYWVIGYFMMSHPSETGFDLSETFELIKRFDTHNLQFFKIHPSTPFYEGLKERGLMNDLMWFQRDFGFHTQYGDEVYYCKELFQEAPFPKQGAPI